jgi:hypothetical protein
LRRSCLNIPCTDYDHWSGVSLDQISADHEREHLNQAIAAFTKIGARYDILGRKKDEVIAKYGM